MSGEAEEARQKRALAVRPGYEVGYGKPPEATRFRKGQSGNPRGRPRGARNKVPAVHEERMKALILEEAYRTIRIRDGERSVSVPIAQAVLRAIAVNALKGQQRSQRLFTELLTAVEERNRAANEAWFCTAIDYKIAWERELRRREVLGIRDLPPPLPHPDHIVIDANAGTARIVGPKTREEKLAFDKACSELRRLHIVRQLCLEAMTEAEDDDERTDLERHVQIASDAIARYRAVLPELYFPVVQDDQFRAEMEAWKQQAEEEISGSG